MSILTAISRGCKGTLADGTVRYTIDFEPRFAIAAAELFAMPGTEMGVVALKDGHGQESPGLSDGTTAVPPDDQFVDANKTIKTAQSDLVKWSGVLSNDKMFWRWIYGKNGDTPSNAEEAAQFIRTRCDITSRSELAHDPRAASIFRGIMKEFEQWKTPL